MCEDVLYKVRLPLTSIHKHQKSTVVNPSNQRYVQGAFTLYVLSLPGDLKGSQSCCAEGR